MNYSEAFRSANRDAILEKSEIDEILEYINQQIKNPFSVDVNYFKVLKKKVTDKEELIRYCMDILSNIEEKFPRLSFDIKEDNEDVIKYAYNIYKFFIKNIRNMTYVFLKEYLYNNKNRKNLISAYMDIKLDSYPKEQYGKKENYILITKINPIIKDIKNSDIPLNIFTNYINKANDSAAYIDIIANLIDSEVIIDDGVTRDIFKEFINSDDYNIIINKLVIWITRHVINPCLEDLGYDLDDALVVIDDSVPDDDDAVTDDEEEDQEDLI